MTAADKALVRVTAVAQTVLDDPYLTDAQKLDRIRDAVNAYDALIRETVDDLAELLAGCG